MKKITTTSEATAPFADQVFFTHKGYTVEVCRRPESLNAAFRLRYRAYLNVDAIPENEEEMLYDEYDFMPNNRVHLVWYDGKPVATVRGCIWSDHYDWSAVETKKYFSMDMDQKLGAGTRLLESNRYAVDPSFKGRQSLFAQILMFHIHALNSAAHDCEYIVTSVREKHISFYRRFLSMDVVSENAMFIPWANANVCLLAGKRENCLQTALKFGLPEVTQADVALYARCAELNLTHRYAMAA